MSDENYDANVRIRDLPRDADRRIDLLAKVRNCTKWEVVRDALIEYTENHKQEIIDAAG